VRTALYSLLLARQQGGEFVLRIEDTDRARSTEESARSIIADMKWLQLHWTEGPGVYGSLHGPYFQSERIDTYDLYIDKLLETGHAYEAWETKEGHFENKFQEN